MKNVLYILLCKCKCKCTNLRTHTIWTCGVHVVEIGSCSVYIVPSQMWTVTHDHLWQTQFTLTSQVYFSPGEEFSYAWLTIEMNYVESTIDGHRSPFMEKSDKATHKSIYHSNNIFKVSVLNTRTVLCNSHLHATGLVRHWNRLHPTYKHISYFLD